MALETLRDIKTIGDFPVTHLIPGKLQESPPSNYIVIHYGHNTIEFQIQDGPIDEVGVNGCQVDTLIETALIIIQGLNKKFPCGENAQVIGKLGDSLKWLQTRKENREARGVEGKNKE